MEKLNLKFIVVCVWRQSPKAKLHSDWLGEILYSDVESVLTKMFLIWIYMWIFIINLL
jgi:hypothetical protein